MEKKNSCQGLPYDGGGMVPGASLAPQMLQDYWQSQGIPNELKAPVARVGSFLELRESISDTMKKDRLPLFIGGDHSITLEVLEETMKDSSHFNLVIFDAHVDAFEKADTPMNWDFVTRILQKFSSATVTVIGFRSHHHVIKGNSRLRVITTEELLQMGESGMGKLADAMKSVYLSIDVDVLDPSCMPAVQSPIGGGLTIQQLLQFAKRFINQNTMAIDICEFNPLLDEGRIGMATFSYLVDRVLNLATEAGQRRKR